MFAVRDNQGRVVRRCRTEAKARVFVRSAKSPVNSRTIKGAEQIVKAALEKNVITTVKAPSGDTYTAGPYTPAVRAPTGHGYVAYGYGRSRFLRPEFRGSAWEVARFLVEYCGRGNALEAARVAAGKNIDHEALLAADSRDRMDRARTHIVHNRNPWAKSPDNTVKSPDGYRVTYLGTGARREHMAPVADLGTAIAHLRALKRRGRTAWVEDTNGAFVPVPGATRQPRFNV